MSLEQRILDSRNSYYVALRQSQSSRHAGTPDPDSWTLYLLRIVEDAYADLEQRVAAGTAMVRATKREQARNFVLTQGPRRFRFVQIVDGLPDISQATIRDALEELRADRHLTVGPGRAAMWERTDAAGGRGRCTAI